MAICNIPFAAQGTEHNSACDGSVFCYTRLIVKTFAFLCVLSIYVKSFGSCSDWWTKFITYIPSPSV